MQESDQSGSFPGANGIRSYAAVIAPLSCSSCLVNAAKFSSRSAMDSVNASFSRISVAFSSVSVSTDLVKAFTVIHFSTSIAIKPCLAKPAVVSLRSKSRRQRSIASMSAAAWALVRLSNLNRKSKESISHFR